MEATAERAVLSFRRGAEYGTFPWVSFYKRMTVGLCTHRFCPYGCALKLTEFNGGGLEVKLELKESLLRGTKFYVAHLVKVVSEFQPSSAGRLHTDGTTEADTAGLTAVRYTDKKDGCSILIDFGVPPNQNGNFLTAFSRLTGVHGLVGAVCTHGHQDHWSLASELPGLPVWVEPLTAEYLGRQEEISHRQAARDALDGKPFTAPRQLNIYQPSETFNVGQFRVRSIPVAHSVPNASMLLVEFPNGKRILHTGDFKFTGMTWRERIRLETRLREVGQMDIEVMYCDNLNAHVPGFTPEEDKVIRGIADIILRAPGRVIVAMFASNLERIKQIATIALDHYRPVYYAGSGMLFALELIQGERRLTAGGEPMDKTVVFATGCQAEEFAVLPRELLNGRPYLWLQEKDTVIFSSRAIPGNEEPVKELAQKVLGRGCLVYLQEGETEKFGLKVNERLKEAFVHVSGHGQAEDIKLALQLVRPKRVVPAVRTSPQIEAFRRIASEVGVEVWEPEENHIIL